MPLLALLIIAIQVTCGIHIVRNNQPYYWLLLIIFLPLVGSLIYFLGIVLPELQQNAKRKHFQQRSAQVFNLPTNNETRLQTLQAELQKNDSAENHLKLAHQLVLLQRNQDAIAHYQAALRGQQQHAPDTLLALAMAQFACNEYANCKNTLDRLIEHNPDFRSSNGHLLYARALSALQLWPQAQHEFEALVPSYPGPEAQLYYAYMLLDAGRTTEAKEQLLAIEQHADTAQSSYRKQHQACLQQAQQALKNLS